MDNLSDDISGDNSEGKQIAQNNSQRENSNLNSSDEGSQILINDETNSNLIEDKPKKSVTIMEEDKHDDSDTNVDATIQNRMSNKVYPISRQMGKPKGKQMGRKREQSLKNASNSRRSKKKAIVDVDKMLSSDEDSLENPSPIFTDSNQDKRSKTSFLNKILPSKKEMPAQKSKKSIKSNIRMKKVRTKHIDNNNFTPAARNNYQDEMDNTNQDYQRNLYNEDQDEANLPARNRQDDSNVIPPSAPMLPNNDNYNSKPRAFDPFRNILGHNLKQRMYKQMEEIQKPKKTAEMKDLFNNLKYGSSLFFAMKKDGVGKKLTTKLRVSDKVVAEDMEVDQYNIN